MYYSQLILSVCVSVCFPDCPDLTTGSLEPLTRFPKLERLTLSGGVTDAVSLEPLTRYPGLWVLTLSGGVPDAVLDSLSGCPGLRWLTLGDLQRPAETAFTAAAVSRSVSCTHRPDQTQTIHRPYTDQTQTRPRPDPHQTRPRHCCYTLCLKIGMYCH